MVIDEVEKIYEKFKELEKKQEAERLKWALRFGNFQEAKAIAEKHHAKRVQEQGDVEIREEMRKMLDELEDQE